MTYFTGDWYADNAIMTDILDDVEFYSGTERKKMLITPKGTGSMLYGYTWRGYLSPTKNRTESIYKGLYNTKVKDLHPELENIFKEFANKHFPEFNYTQVQMNYNFPCPPHFDSKNVGESVLCAFGDYTGGLTCVEKENNNIIKYDPQASPVFFNGSKYKHYVEPFKGNRYSLVFFNNLRQKLLLR